MHEKHKFYFLSFVSEHLAREQLLGYLADNKLKISGVLEKKSLPSYTVAELHVAQPQNCMKLPMDNFFKNLSFLVFVSSTVHLQFFC